MKLATVVIFGILVLLSAVAWRMIPPPPGGGRTPIVWSTDNNPVRQAQVDLFNQQNPDLYLMIDPDNRDMQKVIVQSVGGVGPDIFDSYGAEQLEAFVRAGIALDVTEPLAKAGVVIERDTWPMMLPSCVYEGRTYAFPRNAGANAIWFNKDLFDQAGVPYPKPGWTWDDLIRTAQKLTLRDERGKPKQFGIYWDWNAYQDLVFQFGGRLFTPDGTRCTVDTPEATAGIALGRDLMFKYRVAPTPTQEAALATQGGWGSGGITFLMGGRVAMAFGGRWWLNLMRKQPSLRLGCVEIPYAKKKVVVGYGGAVIANAFGKHTAESARVLAYLASEEYNLLINDQADALAPVRKYAYEPRYMVNPEHPEEDYNAVWRAAIEIGEPPEFSVFLRGSDLAMLRNQMDLVKSDLKPAADACKQAAIDSNERILRNARLKPHLGRLYERLTGRKP